MVGLWLGAGLGDARLPVLGSYERLSETWSSKWLCFVWYWNLQEITTWTVLDKRAIRFLRQSIVRVSGRVSSIAKSSKLEGNSRLALSCVVDSPFSCPQFHHDLATVTETVRRARRQLNTTMISKFEGLGVSSYPALWTALLYVGLWTYVLLKMDKPL